MRGAHRTPATLLLLAFAAVTLLTAGCNRRHDKQGGDRHGKNSKPAISGLQTPLGVTGTRGTGPDVPVIYKIRDREYSVEYIEERVKQFGGGEFDYHDLEPEYPGSLWPKQEVLTKLLKPVEPIRIGSMTIIPDFGDEDETPATD